MPNTQTALSHKDLKVNSGEPKAGEMPLWKGTTTWQVNGQKLVAAVSKDRTYLWVRFVGRDEALPPELNATLANAGFWWSPKPRNLGYFGESTPVKMAALRGMGYRGPDHTDTPAPTPPAKVKGSVSHPAQVEAKGKTTSTPTGVTLHRQNGKRYVAYNSAGRPVWADTGYFVSAKEMVQLGLKDAQPAPAKGPAELMAEYFNLTSVDDNGNKVGHASVTADGELVFDGEPSDAYQFGHEMGRYDRDNGTSSKDTWLQGYEDGLAPDPAPVVEVTATQDDLRQLVLMLAAQQQDQGNMLAKLIGALAGK